MRIAIFTDTFHPDINGVARTLKHFTNYLDEQNIPYKVFAPDSRSNEYISAHIRRFKSFSFFLYPECRLAFPNLFRTKSELENFSPDIIHVATPFNIGLCGVYLAKKLNIPLVGSYHTDFDYYLQFYDLQFLSKIVWKYMKWFHKPFQKLFVPSSETLTQLKRQGFANLEIWPGGVDCQLFHPYYEKQTIREELGITKKYLLTYVGRLAPEKDVKTLLAVAKALPTEMLEQIQWYVVGDGPLREELQQDAPSNMTFTGYLTGERLAEIYSASDVFVFPSPTETFGNVVIEALASGTPVITANSGGVKNIIKSGVTGYLCETGNEAEFVNAILKLLENDNLRSQFGIEGRNYALTQSWEKIFAQLLWRYKSVVEEPKIPKYA
ncbi:glycosyltransferase family 4 protein [Neobacillus bataviensis]|uniref:glycosyltransferase family 4 protein n=1 Tax=Neobacillus bataviensis TaxID=220685 RepID=UPI001CBF2EE7|nr:glycosyltransferase family 1 protein [Neobacillus bataviensis]